jgi:uncharacterized phage protein (TIGR01671 family)
MNRPIKFRVWDKRETKGMSTQNMLYDAQLHHLWQDFVDYPGSYELMQYTGLTDKNGKEIYEGDIIHLKFGELNANLVVKWDKYMGLKYHNGGWTSLVHVETHGEVIGNIFENPELPN